MTAQISESLKKEAIEDAANLFRLGRNADKSKFFPALHEKVKIPGKKGKNSTMIRRRKNLIGSICENLDAQQKITGEELLRLMLEKKARGK